MFKLKLQDYYLFIIFVSVISIAGSLYFSLYLNYKPCDLCWYQRILMFPLPIILIDSLIHNERYALRLVRIMTGIGLILSSYQYVIQFFHIKNNFCSIESDCSVLIIEWFGFVTIPLLAIVAFLIMFLSSFFVKN